MPNSFAGKKAGRRSRASWQAESAARILCAWDWMPCSRIDPQCRWVMIHDGARPLVTPAMLEAGLQVARQHQAAIAAVPIKDTIKHVENGFVTATIDRSQHVAIQTPQVFSFPLIHSAHQTPEAREDVTDDAALLERLGHRVAIFPGSYSNIKITTLEDVQIAEAFLKGATAL